MENWFIEIDEQGNPVGHPYLEENLADVYKEGIPSKFQPFNRMPMPTLNIFQNVGNVPSYEKINGVWQDVWPITSKTDEEIAQVKANIDEYVINVKTLRTDKVNTLIAASSTTDAQKIVYDNYLAQLQAYTVTDYTNFEVPKVPKLDSNGNIIP